MPRVTNLARGMNLWGYNADVNMEPGEALDCQDIMFKPNGSIRRHHGWSRINATALTAAGDGIKGFTYKGKNTPAAARTGNLGIADDAGAADYTRRLAFYSSGIVTTATELRFWNPATQTLDLPVAYHAGPAWLPPGVAIDPDPKPTFLVLQDNVYIFGWGDENLRYDPTDRVLYQMGWDSTPAAPVGAANAAASTLVNGVYRYRTAWIDLYTGEESELGPELVVTTTVALPSVNFAAGAFAAYAGTRKWIGAGADQEVGLVVYRTDPDDHAFFFLTLVRPDGTPAPPVGGGPGLAACTLLDDGLALDYRIKADTRDLDDMPRLNTGVEFRNQIYGLSWDNSVGRFYYNDFRHVKSYYERWDLRNYREVPISEGEMLMATAKTQKEMVIFSNIDAYHVNANPSQRTGKVQLNVRPLQWGVGCVGPKAWVYRDGYLYFMSDRGPYRWPGTGPPEPIGDKVGPAFLDKGTSQCTMLETARSLTEAIWDQDADAVRFIYECTGGTGLNRHLLYFPKTGGWAWASTNAQTVDVTNVFGEGLVGGLPVAPMDKRPRLCFFDDNNYLCEYDPDNERGGLPAAGTTITGVAQAGSAVNLIVTLGGLYNIGDGLTGMRLELVHADGTIEERAVGSNTAVNIVPDVAFLNDPTGGTFYVGGINSYWDSWMDHGGEPESPKTLMHLFLGYNQEFTAAGNNLILDVYGGDFPDAVDVRRTIDLSTWREKFMISLTNRFFHYRVTGTRPDQPWTLTYINPELSPLEARKP